MIRKALMNCTLVVALLVSGEAGAEADPGRAEGAADSAQPGIFSWDAPPASEQLAADTSAVPGDLGAIFVPSLTGDGREPPVLVHDGEGEVTSSRPGKRILLAPGRYRLEVGTAPGHRHFTEWVTVSAGSTVTPRVSWGGIIVDVVDALGKPHIGGYELFSLADGKAVGLGFGVYPDGGARPRPWILPAGVYRLVPPGVGLDSNREVASVTVPEGGLARFRLVIEEAGEMLGGTTITPAEVRAGAPEPGNWRKRLALGLDGNFSHSHEVVGMPDQLFLAGGAFIFSEFTYASGWHLFTASLEVEEGMAFLEALSGEALPLIKTADRARLELRYALLLGGWFGPYVRGFVQTQFFPTDAFFPSSEVVKITRADGSVSMQAVPAGGRLRISEPLAPTVLQGGGGLALNLLKLDAITLTLRAGVADRYSIYNETLARRDDQATPAVVEYLQVGDLNQLGLEGTLDASVRITGWLLYSTGLEYFGDFNAMDAPHLEWRNMLAVKVRRFLTLSYGINLIYLPHINDTLQFQQGLKVRVALNVF